MSSFVATAASSTASAFVLISGMICLRFGPKIGSFRAFAWKMSPDHKQASPDTLRMGFMDAMRAWRRSGVRSEKRESREAGEKVRSGGQGVWVGMGVMEL